MPEINGIDFCRGLSEKHIFKILLTAEADKDTAINAFNNGYIDKFILKTNPNLHEELNRAIHELTEKYFRELSKQILPCYESSIKSLLTDEPFKELFNNVVKRNNIVEYYLIDNTGSFLFLTKNAEPLWLLLSDQKKIDEQVELLKGYNFSDSLIEEIQKKEKLLFLFSEAECRETSDAWNKYIFQSTKVNNIYNYSIAHGYLTHSIKWGDVIPYEMSQSNPQAFSVWLKN